MQSKYMSQNDQANATVSEVQNIIGLLIGIVVIASNAVVFTTIIKSPSLQSMPYNILCNLAFADVGIGVYIVVRSIAFLIVDPIIENVVWCGILFNSGMFFISASLGFYFASTLERYVSIVHPLHNHTILTDRRLRITSWSLWATSFGYAVGNRVLYIYSEQEVYQCLPSVTGLHFHINCLLQISGYSFSIIITI